jgi:hypothetical protein
MATRLSERVSLMLSYASFFLLSFFLLRFFLLSFFLARCVHGREAVLRDIHAP